MLEPRVLVPIEVLDEPIDLGATVRMVSSVPIVLLGYMEVPDQTAPGQMQMQFEEEAGEELARLADAFRETGGEVETRLVFTPELAETFTRVANEEACTAILLPRYAEVLESLLVPIRGEANIERVVDVTARLLGEPSLHATLLHIIEPGGTTDAGEALLSGARDFLEERGVEPSRVHLQVQPAEDPLAALVEAAQGHDAIVLGETEPSLAEHIFGQAHEQVAQAFDGPIVIVRRSVGGDVPDVPDV